jgi:NAD-dependent dihydropyrimidine dehydrogenase PreA subunit
MPYVIAEPCVDVKDGRCVDVCPVDCIKTSDDAPMFYIDPNSCIDCRACELICPVDACFSTYDLPEKWANYEQLNADFFKQ